MRDKPSFYTGGAFWVDPKFLPLKLQNELREILKNRTKLTPENIDAMISECNQEAQFLTKVLQINSDALVREALESITKHAGALLDVMKALPIEGLQLFNLQFDELALSDQSSALPSLQVHREPSEHIAGRFLDFTWDAVADLEMVSECAATCLVLDRKNQVIARNAENLIKRVASAYFKIAGVLPPHSKNTWFPAFIDLIGKSHNLKLPCGEKRVASVIQSMKITGQC